MATDVIEHERRLPAGVGTAPDLRKAMSEWQASVVRIDGVDPFTTEVVRLRCAQHHDCRVCKSVRLVSAKEMGFDEDTTAKIERYESSDLSERHKVALRMADAMMTQPGGMSDALVAQLHEHFTDAELLELTLDVMKWNFQKSPVSLRLDVEVRPGELTPLMFDEHGDWMRPD